MYMRLVQVKVKPDRLPEMASLYEQRVIPELQNMHNCLFATLIYSAHQPDECISLTLWETQQAAETYEQSGIYQRLLGESRPFLADSSEWKVQLSKDLTLEYEPIPEEPVVKSYVVAMENREPSALLPQSSEMYVRIVSAKIRQGKMAEFENLYKKEVLPVLHTTKGCRYAFLTEGVKDRNEIISVTVWNSKEDADEYERSGLFDALKNRLRNTFSDLYQWKMRLDQDVHQQVKTSEDLVVEGYNIVAGKSFL